MLKNPNIFSIFIKKEKNMKKRIENYDGYLITTEGDVLSTRNRWGVTGERKLKPSLDRKGYYFVALMKDGKAKQERLHRLIARAFIPNPDNLPEIDHINGDKTDNRIENLRWCTHQENMNNPITKETISNGHKGKTLSEEHRRKLSEAHKGKSYPKSYKPVEQWSKDGTTLIAVYESMSDAARQTGTKCSNISACCRGKAKSAGGYIWM